MRVNVEAAHFGAIEGTGAAAPKNRHLVAGLVDGAVAVDTLRDGEGRAAGANSGDELRIRARAEAGKMRGVVPRGKNLQDAQAVLPVSDKGEGAGSDHADLHVIELAFGSEELVEFRRIRFFDVNDGEALFPCRNISIGSRHINVAGVFEGDEGARDWFWLCEVGHVENFQPVMIDDERVAELHTNAAGIVELRSADGRGDTRSERIVQVDDHECFVREDVSKRSSDGDSPRASESAARIKRQGALQEIIGGVAVEERANAGALRFEIWVAHDNKPFFFVRDVKEAVERVDRLLLVFRQLLAKRIHGERRG